jgi:hypothetical protein
MALVHHELCFGCGRTNVFGLLLDVQPAGRDAVAGRCFIKQDHQGAELGHAHEGVVIAALSEAMALACGEEARARKVETEIVGHVPVGSFLEIEARVEASDYAGARATATATADGQKVASAQGSFVR